MKRSSIIGIVIACIVLVLIISFLQSFIYFNRIHKDIKPITEAEKEKAIKILNESIDLQQSQIIFGRGYPLENRTLIQVEVIKGGSKKGYLIDLKEERVIKN